MSDAVDSIYHRLFQAMPCRLALCAVASESGDDPDFHILSANPAFYELFPGRARVASNQSIAALFGAGSPLMRDISSALEAARAGAMRAAPAGDCWAVVYIDEVHFALLQPAEAMRLRFGSPDYHDMRARKLESIGRLAGGIAHDFNNIIGAISGYASMIDHKFAPGNPKLQRYSGMIGSASRRAAGLISKLLMFARRSSVELAPIRLHPLIDEAVESRDADGPVHIIRRYEADQPVILGDRTQIATVFQNIFTNAFEAMPDGGALHIHTADTRIEPSHPRLSRYLAPGPFVAISITDSGRGMSEEELSHMFEPFYTTKDGVSGAGLGLASVYGSVKTHRGHIEIDSAPGNGTRATLFFPAARDERQRSLDTRDIVAGEGVIAVIDDEEYMIDMVTELLETIGYEVRPFTRGGDALAYLQQHADEIDLILLDMIMPEMNGAECLARIREFAPHSKVLVASGYIDERDAARVMELGAIDVVRKPFSIDSLSRRVADALAGD
jgi:signal transduction histidine kinase